MKVKELVKRLCEHNQEATVVWSPNEGLSAGIFNTNEKEASSLDTNKKVSVVYLT